MSLEVNLSSESESESVTNEIPPEMLEAAKNVSLNLLPEKSKRQYIATYNDFKKWRKSKKTTSFSEEILIVYFDELKETLASSTMWARYSMLKTAIKMFDNIDIGSYNKLIAFLKKKSCWT